MTEDQLAILDELLADDSDRLNSWECEFLDDLNRRRDRAISERQDQKLNQIWNKLFGGAKSG